MSSNSDKSTAAAAGPVLSEGLGVPRWQWRANRIAELQRELRELLDEEAALADRNLSSTKIEAARIKRAGNKWEAVKFYRERTGLGLKEAVACVDAL